VSTSDSLYNFIAQDIVEQGYSIRTNSIPHSTRKILQDYISQLAPETYDAAGVGREIHIRRNSAVRSDTIAWIPESSPAGARWLEWCSRLRETLNRRLFLGLFSFESHVARYEPGAFYKKHLDAFRGASNRRLSVITYLNDNWSESDGGQLVLYNPEGTEVIERVLPRLGTLVIFLSDEFPHEVLPSKRVRHSIAGWVHVNSSNENKIDPPA